MALRVESLEEQLARVKQVTRESSTLKSQLICLQLFEWLPQMILVKNKTNDL